MKIPDSFRKAIRDAFCDKTIEHYPAKTETDECGDTYTVKGDKAGEYDVNIQIVTDATFAEEYGLTVGRDVCVTSPDSLNIERGDYIVYNSHTYIVDSVFEYDSHIKLICKKV